MKTQKILIALSALMLVGSLSFGQSQNNDPVVRILPFYQEGFVRLLVMESSEAPVTVKFYKGNNLLSTDKVQASNYENGFIKLYDVRKLKNGDYSVKVESKGKKAVQTFTISDNEPLWAQSAKNDIEGSERIAALNAKDSVSLEKVK